MRKMKGDCSGDMNTVVGHKRKMARKSLEWRERIILEENAIYSKERV